MKRQDISFIRLHTQRLDIPCFKSAVEAIEWFGAVQAQDYTGAKWAAGMRCVGLKDADLDDAFRKGEILRTHMMRPTWHFVSPKDIQWILKLTSPRVQQLCAYYYRKSGITAEILKRSNEVIAGSLRGEGSLTRDELKEILEKEGIPTKNSAVGSRIGFLLMNAELEGVICSGGRKGNQFTYALLEERALPAEELPQEDALAILTRRYFTSHGPATVKDFGWWSGLTISDVKKGIALVDILQSEEVDGEVYWFTEYPRYTNSEHKAYLLSNYDEYTIGYTNHDVILDQSYSSLLGTLYPHSIIVDGQVVAGWRREFKKGVVLITVKLFRRLSISEEELVQAASQEYGKFTGLIPQLQFSIQD